LGLITEKEKRELKKGMVIQLLGNSEQLVGSGESITLLSARPPVQDGPDLVFDFRQDALGRGLIGLR
jgi:hypothetical protein